VFIGFEGFGLVTNTAGAMKNPKRPLPISLYASVGIVIVIYGIVAFAVVGNLALSQLTEYQGFVLAEAMGTFAGRFGIVVISVTALFVTASAVNATIFGSANASYQIARDQELPEAFDRKVWSPNAREGLFITTILAILFLDITAVTMLGSAAFLLLYAAVNFGHLRVRTATGAKAILMWGSIVSCLVLFAFLSVYIFQTRGLLTLILNAVLLVFSVGVEAILRNTEYRKT
jgi:amino acid transporter